MRHSNKLLGQGYVKERLKSSLRKCYGRYGGLTKQYDVPLSRMLHAILDDDHIQWHPILIGHYTNFWPLLIWTLLPNLTFYLIVQGFHRTYATGAACQQRTLTPPDTWSCPTLGLACVLMSRPISPKLVLSPDFWISNIPRYFSFALRGTLKDSTFYDFQHDMLSCIITWWFCIVLTSLAYIWLLVWTPSSDRPELDIIKRITSKCLNVCPIDCTTVLVCWKFGIPLPKQKYRGMFHFNHTSLLAVITKTDSPNSVHNGCVIDVFVAFCVVTLLFGFVRGCKGFYHRTKSDFQMQNNWNSFVYIRKS